MRQFTLSNKTVLQVRSVQADHDDLVAQNKSLAEYNLSFQPRLDALKTEVATGYENINKLKTELGMAKARLGNLAHMFMDLEGDVGGSGVLFYYRLRIIWRKKSFLVCVCVCVHVTVV